MGNANGCCESRDKVPFDPTGEEFARRLRESKIFNSKNYFWIRTKKGKGKIS